MPISYHIHQDAQIIHTKCSGAVNMQEVMAHFRELEQSTDNPRHLHVLLDLSETTSLPSADQMRAVSYAIEGMQKKVQFGFCAIVAGTEVMYGMCRMLEVFTAPYFRAVYVFRERAAADVWLAEQLKRPPSTKSAAE